MLFFLNAIADDAQRSFMEALYVEHRAAMYGAAYPITRNHPDTEDVIQHTLLKLMDKVPLLRTLDCFTLRAYIVICVRRAAIDLLRRRRKRSELLFAEDGLLDAEACQRGSPVEERVIREAEAQQLRDALARLKEKQRDLLNMKYFLNLSDDEIAETYGVRPDSVRCLLSRARKALAGIIKEMEHGQP